ncbi:MAG: hypothetical protein AAB315_00225, partial [Pseudomonadota bacterium]
MSREARLQGWRPLRAIQALQALTRHYSIHGGQRYDSKDGGGRAAPGAAAESNGRFRRPCLTRHLCF